MTSHSFERLNSKQRSARIYEIAGSMNDDAEQFLLSEFPVERNLKGIAFGFVTVSWIIAIALLEKGSKQAIEKRKELISGHWSGEETEDFRGYISKSPEISKNF